VRQAFDVKSIKMLNAEWRASSAAPDDPDQEDDDGGGNADPGNEATRGAERDLYDPARLPQIQTEDQEEDQGDEVQQPPAAGPHDGRLANRISGTRSASIADDRLVGDFGAALTTAHQIS
jgi:hypothetical protein